MMAAFDFVVIAVVLISAVWGLARGVVREVLSLVGWVLAVVLAIVFGDDFARYLPEQIHGAGLRFLVAMLVVLLLVLLVAWLLGWLIARLLKAIGLGWLDRLFGFIFGLVRGLVVVLVFVLIAGLTNMPQEHWWKRSALAPMLETVVLGARPALPQAVAKRLKYS